MGAWGFTIARGRRGAALAAVAAILASCGPPFAACPGTNEGTFAPGDAYETCVLFLVPPGREATRVSWLPSVPGTETDFVSWAIP